jgi:hypothetical protein
MSGLASDDRRIIVELFGGRFSKLGKLRWVYLNREEENAARKTLARLLLSGEPLDFWLRHLLAISFDPDSFDPNAKGCLAAAEEASHRVLIFKFRGRKRRRQPFRDNVIFAYMVNSLHAREAVSVKDAQRRAAKKFGLSYSAVTTIWKKQRAS